MSNLNTNLISLMCKPTLQGVQKKAIIQIQISALFQKTSCIQLQRMQFHIAYD